MSWREEASPPSSWPGLSRPSTTSIAALVLIVFSLASPAHTEIALDQRRSGYDQMSPATKQMQDDDTSNPATLSVLDGETLWGAKAGSATSDVS